MIKARLRACKGFVASAGRFGGAQGPREDAAPSTNELRPIRRSSSPCGETQDAPGKGGILGWSEEEPVRHGSSSPSYPAIVNAPLRERKAFAEPANTGPSRDALG